MSTRTRGEREARPKCGLLGAVGLAAAVAGVAILGAANVGSAQPVDPVAATPATPTIRISAPLDGASYQRGSRILARFHCNEKGLPARLATCTGAVANRRAINTTSDGTKSFTVTATDTSGNTVTKTVQYSVWEYVNPLRAVGNLQASRIDMGVDYSGAGPILALGRAKVALATDRLAGPESCWGKTCVPPPGDMIVYRLLDGPYAGKYVYVVEHITIGVKAGQMVRAGEMIATLHQGSPNLELGWATGNGAYTLAAARHHQGRGTDPGGWSSIEGRNFNALLVWLGAPSGYVTTAPSQQMPKGWPTLPARVKPGG
ncbi:MAG: hypothetical protein JO304_14170 [Solirubrobacterales bacterium]|nr:hypothetical protein [Solirubrobacterales bacterium]